MSLPIFSVFFRFFPFFFRFLPFFSVSFRFFPFLSVFFRFLPFFSVFFRFFPFHFQKKRGDTVRETPFAKPQFWKDDQIVRDLDGPIRANRFADSRESSDSRESFQGSRTKPPICESRFGGAKKLRIACLRRFARIASKVLKLGFFQQIDSRESICADRPDSRVLPEDYCKEDPCNFPWGGELARS